jgi:phosphate starvation-inducible PhoH-like protein
MALFGQANANLKAIEREVGVTIGVRGNELTLVGPADRVALGRSLVEQLYQLAKKGKPLAASDIGRAVAVLAGDLRAQI